MNGREPTSYPRQRRTLVPRSVRALGRRGFLGGAAGAAGAAAFPWDLWAQTSERVRHVAVLLTAAADDPDAQRRSAAFQRTLQQLGWIDGRNVRIEHRWAAGDVEHLRKFAAESIVPEPDVILASGGFLGPLLAATRKVPIVFVSAADPVGAGHVESLSRPGGNATGFTLLDFSLNAKWLELLKEIAPNVTRAGVFRAGAAGIAQFAVIQSVASSVGVDVSPINIHDAGEIERGVGAFARTGKGGLIVTASTVANVHRDLIVDLAARHRLPAVYFERLFVAGGGLASYGADLDEQYRRAAGYVDRVLRGEKPADLPVQAPTKYDLVVNLRTAKALGLVVPESVLARADEVIE